MTKQKTQKAKNRKILLYILIGITFIIGIIILGYILFNKKNIKYQYTETIKTGDNVNDKISHKTYTNLIWGIEFQHPNNLDISVRENESNISIIIYTDYFYFNPVAIDGANINDFESLKLYFDNKYPHLEKTVFKNSNNIYFYKFTTDTSDPKTYYYSVYNGKKPFNAIAFNHSALKGDSGESIKKENIEIYESIIDSFNFIERDNEMAEKYFQEKGINPECQGWYATAKYEATNTLTKLTNIEDISNKTKYISYNNKNITFNYPNDWTVEYDKALKQYRINNGVFLYLSLSIGTTSEHVADYRECQGRCFKEESPISPFSWKAFYCSENYSLDNINKFLSGDFIDFLSTGSLPPGGVGEYLLKRNFNDKFISASYSSENFQYYPKTKSIYSSSNPVTEEEQKIMLAEQSYYQEEFYKIVKSVKLK